MAAWLTLHIFKAQLRWNSACCIEIQAQARSWTHRLMWCDSRRVGIQRKKQRERRHGTWQTDHVQLNHLSYFNFKNSWVKGYENSPLMANMTASRWHVKIKWTFWLVSSSGTSQAEMSDTWLAFLIRHFSSPPVPQVLYSMFTISSL